MKKMLNFKYVIVGFLLVLCGACSDFLDLEPKNKYRVKVSCRIPMVSSRF